MNQDAGHGGLLLVTCRLADGKKLPLVVDTGAQITAFDKSLGTQLGKRNDTGTVWNFSVPQEAGVYAAPKLYLGKVSLRISGTNVVTFDRQQLSFHDRYPFMGFLGMDVLQNYCLQMDFAAGKMRFLDSHQADKTNWGRPFPLTDIGDGCFAISENLAGVKGAGSVIDTGCNQSGWLRPEMLQQWTNQAASGKVHAPDGVLGGETYRDLDLLDVKLLSTSDLPLTSRNGIGLRVLAQNLVTLDFPNRVMYLKRAINWPLADKPEMAAMMPTCKSALNFLFRLKRKNQLPGFSKSDRGRTTGVDFNHNDSPYLDSVTWNNLKNGDPSIYHYTFTRTSQHGSWKLQKHGGRTTTTKCSKNIRFRDFFPGAPMPEHGVSKIVCVKFHKTEESPSLAQNAEPALA